jgi:hypothetical protein
MRSWFCSLASRHSVGNVWSSDAHIGSICPNGPNVVCLKQAAGVV